MNEDRPVPPRAKPSQLRKVETKSIEQPKVSGESATRIVMDIGNQIEPEDSSLDYGPDELEFRKIVEKQFDDYRKEHPDAILDVKE